MVSNQTSSFFHRARSCGFISKPALLQHSCPRRPRGPLARACRTYPLHEPRSNNTTRAASVRMSKSFHELECPMGFNRKAFNNQLIFNEKSSRHHRARSCGFIGQPTRFHYSCRRRPRGPLARAHVELTHCTNPYQIKPCGPHARADVGIRPIILLWQCVQHKSIKNQ